MTSSTETNGTTGPALVSPLKLGGIKPYIKRTESSDSSESEDYERQPSSAKVAVKQTDTFEVDIDEADRTIKDAIPGLTRRDSLPMKIERTDKHGHYVLTADDPMVLEILKHAITQQQQSLESSHSAKKRKAFGDIMFTRQFTTFDRQNPSNSEAPFFGFFTLFWIGMALMLARVAFQNYRENGSLLGSNEVLKIMFSKDIVVLGLSDAVMCASTAFGLLFQVLVFRGWINWDRTGWIIQNVWQMFYLGACIGWTFYREWPWTHTVFTALHAMVFLMKQHSYAFYNGYLSEAYKRRSVLVGTLKKLKSKAPAEHATSPKDLTHEDGRNTNGQQDGLRNRRPMHRRTSSMVNEKSEVASVAHAISKNEPLDSEQMSAFAEILEAEIEFLDGELRGKCKQTDNHYPANLNLLDFCEWTCFPTLVYELEYPRQERRDWWYILEKVAATFGVLCLMQVVSQAYIYPAVVEAVAMKEQGLSLAQRWENLPYIISDMLFPLLLEQLLTWYVIWECVLNVLAEATRFADRGFYGAWWNSTSFDQYARLWNYPVHAFLLRHVYHSSISAFHLKKSEAMFATFLLSALLHELLMFCLFKKVRGYLFVFQLMQLPLAAFSRTKLMRGRKVLGNVMFWFGLFIGPSIITGLYLVI